MIPNENLSITCAYIVLIWIMLTNVFTTSCFSNPSISFTNMTKTIKCLTFIVSPFISDTVLVWIPVINFSSDFSTTSISYLTIWFTILKLVCRVASYQTFILFLINFTTIYFFKFFPIWCFFFIRTVCLTFV